MFAAPLYFHPHYFHAEFYARSERKTEQVLRANKIQTKLKGGAGTVPVNLAKANLVLCGTEERKGFVTTKMVKQRHAGVCVCVWPSVHPGCTSVHENVQIITHQQSQGRRMEQSLP